MKISDICMQWIPNKNAKPWVTIYSSSSPKKHVILILSGAYKQNYCFYIEKIVQDILELSHIREKYVILFYEDLRDTNLFMAEPISQFLQTYHENIQIEELVLLGISAGGIVASHIASKLDNLQVNKIITYDTPLNLIRTLTIHSSSIFRFDIFFYYLFYLEYTTHHDNQIRENLVFHIKPTANNIIESVINLHNISYEELVFAGKFNYNLPNQKTQIMHIYSEKDPVLIEKYNTHTKDFLYQCANPIFLEKYTYGHSSDMAFDTEYLHYLNHAIMNCAIMNYSSPISKSHISSSSSADNNATSGFIFLSK